MGEKWLENFAKEASRSCFIGFFYMSQIYNMGPMALLPLQRKHMLRVVITHKNPLPSARFEPASLGPMASILTTRPMRAILN
jgi:hypothetical protein